MSKLPRYGLGLVVGKFAPLHSGHEWLVEQAAAQCDRLVILSYTKPEFERCGPLARQDWMNARFAGHQCIAFDDDWLSVRCAQLGIAARQIPPNNSDDDTHHTFLAWLLAQIFQCLPDAFFCSESYGQRCSVNLTRLLGHPVRAVEVDPLRIQCPISASQIRNSPQSHLDWLAPEVRSSFILRVGILGGESSGKSTLAQALGSCWVLEYGRELWEQKQGVLEDGDLVDIAHEQMRRETEALCRTHQVLVCDTTPVTTLGYSLWMFGYADPELERLAQRPYDGLILCAPDFPFVQDGTRRDDGFRRQQHDWYVQQLQTNDCPVLQVGGTLHTRVQAALHWLGEHWGVQVP